MSNAKISKLTKEELESAKTSKDASKPASSVSHAQNNPASPDSTYFISKLPLKDVAKFFEPFGVKACQKVPNDENPQFIAVRCNDFDVVFTDYNIKFDVPIFVSDEEESTKFKPTACADFCESIQKLPEQILTEKIQIELFGQRFEAYSKNLKKIKLSQLDESYAKLPKTMKPIMKLAYEQKKHEIESSFDKVYYGTYSGIQGYNSTENSDN